MDFTEKLKNTLTTNIKPPKIQKTLPKAVTKPATTASIPVIPAERAENKLNNLIVNTVKKIKSTPYWKEYSEAEQQKMICRYFDVKIKSERYSDMKIGMKEKLAFVEEVIERAQKI